MTVRKKTQSRLDLANLQTQGFNWFDRLDTHTHTVLLCLCSNWLFIFVVERFSLRLPPCRQAKYNNNNNSSSRIIVSESIVVVTAVNHFHRQSNSSTSENKKTTLSTVFVVLQVAIVLLKEKEKKLNYITLHAIDRHVDRWGSFSHSMTGWVPHQDAYVRISISFLTVTRTLLAYQPSWWEANEFSVVDIIRTNRLRKNEKITLKVRCFFHA